MVIKSRNRPVSGHIYRSHNRRHQVHGAPFLDGLADESTRDTKSCQPWSWISNMPDVHSTDRLIALFIAALCTGVYICTLLLSVRWLVFKDEGWSIRQRISKGFLAATLALAVLSTVHTVLAVTTSVARIREAESPTPSTQPNEKVPWESVVMCTVVNASVLMVDSFLIYRCWAVSSYRKRTILFPILFWIGGFICTVLQLYWQVVQTAHVMDAWTPVNMTIGPGTVLTPFWGCTIVVNIYATGVIVYHIWVSTGGRRLRRSSRRWPISTSPFGAPPQAEEPGHIDNGDFELARGGMAESRRELRFVVRVLVESGALYLLITIPHFAVWWTSSGLAIITLGWMGAPVTGDLTDLFLKNNWHERKSALCGGVYISTLLLSVRWLVFKDEGWSIRQRISKGFLAATLALAVFSTVHTVLAVTTSIAKIRETESPTHSTKPDEKVPWESVVMCTVVNASVLMVDGFLIYRCWAVSSYRKRKILFPVLFWIGGLVCTILQLYWQVVQTAHVTDAWTPVNMTIGPGTVLTPFWGCTIVVNIYATGVIVYHIWINTGRRRQSQSPKRFPINLSPSGTLGPTLGAEDLDNGDFDLMRAESGALYLLITIPHFAVWWTSSGLAIISLGWANLPVVGTAFNLIIVRTARYRVDADRKAEANSALMSEIKFERPVGAMAIPGDEIIISRGHVSTGSICTGSSATAYGDSV
ncbi:hypothetical protein D9619_011836 [Psilocybe cf. subviscida]|uniref:Uncharacterized protein n=1 Tax=Psilocybe cf. subviscida TaxID=2480587 RepID=A0A8H5EW00_9AGAR|nr:hypothetical protein D9619_011836 [Psilocybe cf. subviscida]